MKFAVQLYSLRNEVEGKGLFTVLEEVAAAGYDGVEFAGLYGFTPKQIKEKLDSLGLAAMGAHVALDEIADFCETATELGLYSVAVPWLDKEVYKDDRGNVAAKLFAITKIFQGTGIRVLYHNHDFEFENGQDWVKEFLDAAPDLKAELDVFWLTASGINAVKYVKSLGNRVDVLHIKEMSRSGVDAPNPVVGEGIVKAKKLLQLAQKAGMEWAVLEVEKFPVQTDRYLRESLAFMKSCVK